MVTRVLRPPAQPRPDAVKIIQPQEAASRPRLGCHQNIEWSNFYDTHLAPIANTKLVKARLVLGERMRNATDTAMDIQYLKQTGLRLRKKSFNKLPYQTLS